MSALSDQLGIDIEGALRTAPIPSGQPLQSDYDFPTQLEQFKSDLAAWGILAGQESWKAGAAAMISYLGGIWAPLTDVVTVGSTVTSFTVGSGLSLDADGEWLLRIRLNAATGTLHFPRLGLRGVFSSGSYYSTAGRALVGDPGGHAGELRILAGGMNAAERMTATIQLSKRSGDYTLGLGRSTYSNSSPGTDSFHFSLTDRATSDVPTIQVGSDVSSRILAGTEAQLFRRIL